MILSDKELQRIKETIAIIPKDVSILLDAGCGDGRVSRAMEGQIGLTGIDIVPCKIGAYPGNKIIGNIGNLPIKTRKFDMVLICEVIEHFDESSLSSALQEMERVTKRYILVTVPFNEVLPAQWHKCSKCSSVYHAWGHLRNFNLKRLRSLFKNSRLVETRFLGAKEPRIPSIFYIIARNLGNVWESDLKKPTPCPNCGSLPINHAGNIFGKLFIRLIWRVERIWAFKRAVLIGCLYETHEE